jgi:hypothetical protein
MDSVNYTIKINKIFSGYYGNNTDTVIRVDWTLTGTFRGLTYNMPQSINLTPPNGGQYIPLANITDTTLVSWIEQQCAELPNLKLAIENTLRQQDTLTLLTVTDRTEE